MGIWMEKIKNFISLVRIHECLPLVIPVLFPIILFKRFEISLMNLLLYASFITIYGFVINDIADANLDKLNAQTRNPISKSKLSKYHTTLFSFLMLSIALYFLLLLPPMHIILGIFVATLYILYSFVFKAKSRPIFDLVFHGLPPSLFFIMGYILYGHFDITSLIIAFAIFFLSSIAELLQEIRDFDSDRKIIVNTVIRLGQEASIKLSIVFLTASTFSALYLIYIGLFSSKLLIGFPLLYLIFSPLFTSLHNKKIRKKLIYIYSKWVVLLTIIFIFLTFI